MIYQLSTWDLCDETAPKSTASITTCYDLQKYLPQKCPHSILNQIIANAIQPSIRSFDTFSWVLTHSGIEYKNVGTEETHSKRLFQSPLELRKNIKNFPRCL